MASPAAVMMTSFPAAALQQRPIIAVYHHLKRIRNPMRQGEGGTGAWTPAQDMALRQFVLLFVDVSSLTIALEPYRLMVSPGKRSAKRF
jgi:hypothetical protein